MVASPKQQVLVHWCSSCARKLGSGRRERTKSSLKSVIGESVNPYIPTVSLSQTAHIGPHNSSYLPDTYEYVSYSSYRSLFIVQCYGSIPVRTRLHIDSITLFTDTCYVVPVPDTHLIPQVLGYLGREAERERERESTRSCQHDLRRTRDRTATGHNTCVYQCIFCDDPLFISFYQIQGAMRYATPLFLAPRVPSICDVSSGFTPTLSYSCCSCTYTAEYTHSY